MASFSKGASFVKHFALWKLCWWNENDVILPHSPNSTDSWLIHDDLRKPLGNDAFDMPTINQHRTLIWSAVRPTKNNFVEPYRIVHIWTANVRPTIGLCWPMVWQGEHFIQFANVRFTFTVIGPIVLCYWCYRGMFHL